jgi:serine acetyltransferase
MPGSVESPNGLSSHGRARSWSEADPGRPLPFWASLRADIVAHVPKEERTTTPRSWAFKVAGIVVRSSGFHVMAIHRLAHTLAHRGGFPGRAAAGLLFWWLRHFYGCAIASTARLHGGVILPHPQGIVIGAGVVIGPRAWIFQNVTVGGAPGKVGMPRVGAVARIYCGAVLTGPIVVGDNVMVGANAVVFKDVPDRTLVRCSPAEYTPLPEHFHCTEEETRG